MMTETVLFFKDLNHLIAVYYYIALELFLATCKCGSRHRNNTTMKKLIVLIRACE